MVYLYSYGIYFLSLLTTVVNITGQSLYFGFLRLNKCIIIMLLFSRLPTLPFQ